MSTALESSPEVDEGQRAWAEKVPPALGEDAHEVLKQRRTERLRRSQKNEGSRRAASRRTESESRPSISRKCGPMMASPKAHRVISRIAD